ncbi:MAG: bifunctional hexulose-6-phosphate synthase/ribonuclease regulator [Candidatus Hecatellales archaeon]|nr:MAG: bifunctional hexulose-6-phosphate synthase/ribonuclease regulator [Candidatus Hecatellales archaeon]
MKPILQVALDFSDLHRALKVAEEAVKGGADWLEAGTPLIKSEGLNAVRELRKRFPGRKIVADMKTMDTGSVEVEMAAKAGADIVIVLGASDDSTVREAVEAGRRYGAEIMVDLIGVEKMAERALRLEELGVNYLCVHVGIDQQMRGLSPVKVLRELSGRVKIPLAVAGGITSETAVEALKAGASILIVGGAIIKAADAAEAARRIKKALQAKRPLASHLYRKIGGVEEVKALLLRVSTPNISDAMHRRGEMEGIKPVVQGLKMVGQAFTVRTFPGDWAKPIEAIEQAKPGEIIVIEAQGRGKAIWGELATYSAVGRRLGGVVIDGAVRDVEVIRQLSFPVYAREITPTAGDPKGFGEIGVEITCGGVKVKPGDWVVGDDNGVVVIPEEQAVEIANRAEDVREKEERIRAEIKAGSTLSEVLKIKKWEKLVG